MDRYEKIEAERRISNSTKIFPSVPDIDQLCNLIDESTFGLQSFSSSKLHAVPSTHVKAFRLKRLHTKVNFSENEHPSLSPSTYRTISMRLSLPSSVLSRFRSLSTYDLPKSRRYSTPTMTYRRAKSARDEQIKAPSTPPSQISCAIVDARRAAGNACNVEELAAYLDDFLYLPKSLSGAAELMYT